MKRDFAEILKPATAGFDDEPGLSDTAEQARLEQWVLSDPANARAYIEWLDQEVCLRRRFSTSASRTQRPRKLVYSVAVTALSSCIAASALLFFHLVRAPHEANVVHQDFTAKLRQSVGCVWKTRSISDGESLGREAIELQVGLVEIEFASQVTVVVEGPAELDILGPKLGRLRRGSVVIRVPPGATGFVLETPGNRLIDYGTEFGVSVGEEDRTLVQVYDGEVRTSPETNIAADSHQITARQALVLSANGESLATPAFAEGRFVRLLPPKAQGRFQYLPASNQSRIEEIHISHATTPPIIDGKLNDWQQSKFFHSSVDPPFDQNYFIDGAMAYDAEFLYFSGRVGDPFPLRNQFDPTDSPDVAWKGGALRVRLALDASWSYPLAETRKMPPEQAASERFVHLLFWYHQPSEKPCLFVTYGLDLHRNTAASTGWHAAYQPSPDGRGYVLEYALPWSLLNVDRPRELGGHTLAASWQLHWSNSEGRIWQGHLIECALPGAAGHPRSNANQWGRAVFENAIGL